MLYENRAATGKIASVEFSTSGKDSLAFVRLRGSEHGDEVRAWLGEPSLQQQVVSQTHANDGTLLVIRSKQPSIRLLEVLAQHGETLAQPVPVKKPFNPWAWRGATSLLGQGLQIVSSFKTQSISTSERRAILIFAASNLVANAINIVFGGQKKDDPYQLRQLKNDANAKLAPYVARESLPDADDKALSHRPAEHETVKQIGMRWLKKYSVSFGEIGLRTLGSASLAFPLTQLVDAAKAFGRAETIGGRFKEFFNAAKCTNKATFIVGLTMLTGKFVSFASKEPDPYNPKPPSMLDTFREKVTFRLSSIIEGSAAAYMAHDRFVNKKIEIGGNPHPDYFGGIGNVVFVGGYGVRLFADYGTREVNMPELYAHIGNALAKVPDAQRPALLAQTASDLYEHFKSLPDDKTHSHSLSTIYENLQKELTTYHAPKARITAERTHENTVNSPSVAAPTL